MPWKLNSYSTKINLYSLTTFTFSAIVLCNADVAWSQEADGNTPQVADASAAGQSIELSSTGTESETGQETGETSDENPDRLRGDLTVNEPDRTRNQGL